MAVHTERVCAMPGEMCIRDSVYAETGEQQLMKNLTSIWNDIVTRKMYVTGACGALYEYISIQRFENQMYLPFSRLTVCYSLEKIERVV